jgi:PIN domain nuclease of toxin-antitoxin system
VRFLLDTQVVLWQLSGERTFSERARETIAGAAELVISVVSFAEIGVKAAVGKLEVPTDLQTHVAAAGLRTLGLTREHGLAVAGLPLHHRDPFDRLLVAQARLERFTLVTTDERIRAYDVAVLDPFVT